MKKKSCAFEKEMLDGLRTGVLTPQSKEHGETCAVCRESMAIQRWMNRFQAAALETEAARKKLPDVESLWERAYVTPTPTPYPDKGLEKKALIPLLFPQVLAYAAAIIVIISLFISNLPGLKALLQTNPELPVMITSFLMMFKAFLKSVSYMLIPMAAGLLAMIIFTVASALEGKNFRGRKQYIF
ncbi:MAG TPA: hypothetical protein VK469_13640 [Candidatus Kapabacteria bacterium]|nr:hypothetical protein [Candidatus Kapabacteria bacterium]